MTSAFDLVPQYLKGQAPIMFCQFTRRTKFKDSSQHYLVLAQTRFSTKPSWSSTYDLKNNKVYLLVMLKMFINYDIISSHGSEKVFFSFIKATVTLPTFVVETSVMT